MYVGQNAVIMTLGLILIGFGFSTIMPAFFACGRCGHSGQHGCGERFLSVWRLRIWERFISTFWGWQFLDLVFGESVLSGIMIEIVVFLIIGVIFLIYSPFREKKA